MSSSCLATARMVDWQWSGNVKFGEGITVHFLTDRPQPDETYEVVSHVRRADGSSEIHEMRYCPHPPGWGYIFRDDVSLHPSGTGAWVKATGDLNRALEHVVQESTGSLASGSQSIAEEAGSEDPGPSPASPDGDGSIRWLLALPALGLAAGAAWLLWLGLRSEGAASARLITPSLKIGIFIARCAGANLHGSFSRRPVPSSCSGSA